MRHRWLLQNLITREIRARYLGSATGLLWALLQPLALLAIYAFVFSTIFQIRFPELGGHRFLSFVAVALWPWQMLSDGIQRGMASIQANAGMIQKVAFPREILVYANVISVWLIHLAGYAAVLLVLLFMGEAITPGGSFLALLSLLSLLFITTALALVLAALQVFLRDVEHVIGPLLMIVFYATPILYPVSLVPADLRWAFQINPIAYLAGRLRDALLHSGQLAFGDAWLLIGAAIAFWAAVVFFRRLADHFEDFL
jgi:lipopolysaccharide transport system permease protein